MKEFRLFWIIFPLTWKYILIITNKIKKQIRKYHTKKRQDLSSQLSPPEELGMISIFLTIFVTLADFLDPAQTNRQVFRFLRTPRNHLLITHPSVFKSKLLVLKFDSSQFILVNWPFLVFRRKSA